MKIIILTGGKGTRLQHLVKDRPKPMALVNNRPFLEYLLLNLKQQGFKDIILTLGYKGNYIRKHFGTGQKFGLHLQYVYEKKLLGTGGAVRNVSQKYSLGKDFIIINGDCYTNVNIKKLIETHKQNKSLATLALVNYKNPDRYGLVQTRGSKIVKFQEKKIIQGRAKINAGIYVFSRQVLKHFPDQRVISLETEVFPNLIKYQLHSHTFNCYFIDIGVEKDFFQAQKDLALIKLS